MVSRASPSPPTLSEDAHTVLVEFSSVVADTQEYIIEVWAGVMGTEVSEHGVALCWDGVNEI